MGDRESISGGSGDPGEYSGTSLIRTPLGQPMCVRNMGVAVFQGLPW